MSGGHTTLRLAAVALLGSVAAASAAAAHSTGEVEQRLAEQERYMVLEEEPFPSFTLQDADGESVRLDDFRGKVVVLNFIYATCPDVCPLHSELMADIQERINETPLKNDVQFVSITTDPENDTPEVLRAYGPDHGLEPTNWTFLRSEAPDATRELASRLKQKFTRQEGGTYQHAAVTYVIDRDGVLRARYFGIRFDKSRLVEHIQALAAPPDDHGGWLHWLRGIIF